MKEPLLISRCLCGEPCRYDGIAKWLPAEVTAALAARFELIPVCPECVGGLPTPRPSAERQGDRVVNTAGVDVTAQYKAGAEAALVLCREHGCTRALLKANSPSCGRGRIYDGTFTRTLTRGNGVTAERLLDHGIAVYTEEEIAELMK